MFKNFTALYVEDELQLQNIISNTLDKLFFKVYTANNGQEGLELYKKNISEIDIVITDINMPKLNGLEMCEKIRETNKDIPLIITTAYNDNDFLHHAIEIGVSKFVTKPIDLSLLFEKINEVFQPIRLKRELEDKQKEFLGDMLKNAKFSATGKLAAGITHEINTPLTYVKANIELMKFDVEDLEDSKTKTNLLKTIETLDEGIIRIENIVTSMREISVQKTLEPEIVNIYNTLNTASTIAWNKIKHVAPLYINGELFQINNEKDRFVFKSKVQVQRIEQVWIIIINNALDELKKVKNYKDRKLEIQINDDNENIFVYFKDTAGGIKEEIIPYIFEPFKGTKNSSGVGVGLSIAKKILEDHEGTSIDVYNENGGAVFKITLPKYKI